MYILKMVGLFSSVMYSAHCHGNGSFFFCQREKPCHYVSNPITRCQSLPSNPFKAAVQTDRAEYSTMCSSVYLDYFYSINANSYTLPADVCPLRRCPLPSHCRPGPPDLSYSPSPPQGQSSCPSCTDHTHHTPQRKPSKQLHMQVHMLK